MNQTRTLRFPIAAVVLVLALACSQTYFARFQQENPDWDFSRFPDGVHGIRASIAAIERPPGAHERTALSSIHAYDVESSPWTEVQVSDLFDDPELRSGHNYLLTAKYSCAMSEPGLSLWYRWNTGTGWYLFESDRLSAYQHYSFGRKCEGTVSSESSKDLPDATFSCFYGFANSVSIRARPDCGALPPPSA